MEVATSLPTTALLSAYRAFLSERGSRALQMYLRLHDGEGEDSYLEIQKANQDLSPRNRIGLFEFWDNLFIECGRLTYAIDHFRHSIVVPICEADEKVNSQRESKLEVVSDENFLLDIGVVSTYYGISKVSMDSISGDFEPDLDSSIPPFLPALELFGSPQRAESHPMFYGYATKALNRPVTHRTDDQLSSQESQDLQNLLPEIDQSDSDESSGEPEMEPPRIEVVASVAELCRFHENVEKILCAQSTDHAKAIRRLGEKARRFVKAHNWVEALKAVIQTQGCGNSNWIDARLTSKNEALSEGYERKSIDKLFVKILTFDWYTRSSNRRHPSDIAGDLWDMLADHRQRIKWLAKHTEKRFSWSKEEHYETRVILEAIYQLVRGVPGLSPKKAWERHLQQLLRIGIESNKDLTAICKSPFQINSKKKSGQDS